MRGSLREKPAGSGRWELRVYLGRDPVTGRPRQLSRVVRGSKRSAQTELARLVADTSREGPTPSDVTVADLLERHLAHLERRGITLTTLHAYRRYARLRINPAIGRVKLRALNAFQLDELYAAMAADAQSPATVRQVHAVLSGALGQAVKWGWIGVNPARSASPPSVRPAGIRAPTTAEVRRLIDAAVDRDPSLGRMVLLAALTGARRGELCALRWTDLDFERGTVRIARSIADLPGRVVEKDTKSHQCRTISLGAVGVEALREHRAEMDERARAGETAVGPDGYVFSRNLDAATPIRPDWLTGFFTRVRDDLGLPDIHLHSLRHFTATALAGDGRVALRTVAGRLGHGDASVTARTYADFVAAGDSAAAELLGDLLRPADERPLPAAR